MNEEDLKTLKWLEFVATKFQSDRDGWKYSRDVGKLKHIRYEHDYTGYHHWTKRLKRAVAELNPFEYAKPKKQMNKLFPKTPTIRGYFRNIVVMFNLHLKKDSNLPDGVLVKGDIITHWEEHGEYLTGFQPRVGVKVIEFLRAEPENPYAVAIMNEIRDCVELSFPTKEKNND